MIGIEDGKYLSFAKNAPSHILGFFVVDGGCIVEHYGDMIEISSGPISLSTYMIIQSIKSSTVYSLKKEGR